MSAVQEPFTTGTLAPLAIGGLAVFSFAWGIVNALLIRNVDMESTEAIEQVLKTDKALNSEGLNAQQTLERIKDIGQKITTGAISFLTKEYCYLGIYSAVVSIILTFTVDWEEMSNKDEWRKTNFPYTATSYLIGSVTSILAGYVGMRIAVYSNTRTTFQCCKSVNDGFMVAFRGGQVLGFCLVGLALFVLEIIILVFKSTYYDGAIAAIKAGPAELQKERFLEVTRVLFELVAGYGLGGSSVALFGRVGGGIYTKAADVGADLVGKVVKDLREDDPSNPGTIADNVGDNVGDIAGMGADLFGSLAESTCAALVVSATSIELVTTQDALWFPLLVTASGIIASFVSVLCIHLKEVTIDNVGPVLKWQIGISTVLMTATVLPCLNVLPETGFKIGEHSVQKWDAYGCIMFGLWSGMIIGFITEYYTSNNYGPTLRLVQACEQGPAPNIIHGLALGYGSVVVPILCITATIYYAFAKAGMYGIALGALGMLGSLPVALTIDGYGPISDNAGGISEMSYLPSTIRDKTDALDAAGNTTAAVGKGFAIGSACLVGLALFGAFITRVQKTSVDILQPAEFAGLLVGAMLPYAFSAMTMTAVGDAAEDMMIFIKKDFEKGQEAVKNGQTHEPDYQGCIKISTEASLKKMIAPGALVLGAPLAAGFLFGPRATAGLLAGAIVSGVQVAISASNTGGAWDNAKKEAEKRRSAHRSECRAQGLDLDEMEKEYKARPNNVSEKVRAEIEKMYTLKEIKNAAVCGDTVGDPLKDTSGPAINILIKLSAITSLVFGSYIANNNLWGDKPAAAK